MAAAEKSYGRLSGNNRPITDYLKNGRLIGFAHYLPINRLIPTEDSSYSQSLRQFIFIQKAKRPEVVKDLDPNSKKRSEVTPILLREATKLEEDEGRQQIKFTFPKTTTVPAGLSNIQLFI